MSADDLAKKISEATGLEISNGEVTIDNIKNYQVSLEVPAWEDTPQHIYASPKQIRELNKRLEFVNRLMSKKTRKTNRNA